MWLTVLNSYTVVGAVVVGAGWYLYRLARGPEGGSSFLNVPFVRMVL